MLIKEYKQKQEENKIEGQFHSEKAWHLARENDDLEYDIYELAAAILRLKNYVA